MLFGKQVEIILVLAVAELCPRTLGKEVAPIVGNLAVFAFLDDIVIAIFFLACECSFKPFVLVGGVIDDQVHDDFDATGSTFFYEAVEVRHGAVFGMNGFVVGNVISVVVIGAVINGTEPNHVHAQIF